MSASSSGVNVMSAAPMFSAIRSICFVPGIGTIRGFCASSQARAMRAGGGMLALGESLDIFDQHHIVPEVVRPEAGDGRCVPMSFSSCLLMFGMFLRWCEVSPACRRCV